MTETLAFLSPDTAFIHKIRSIDNAYEPGAYFLGQSRPILIRRQRSHTNA